MEDQAVTAGLLAPFAAGLGAPDLIAVPTPGAGANASFLVPGDFTMRVLAAMATLTTSAAAANRFLSLDFLYRQTITFCRNGAGIVTVANVTNLVYSWNAYRTAGDAVANTPVLSPVAPLFLPPGTLVQFTVDNIQAADQLSALSLYVEKFETGDRGYPQGLVPPGD